MGHDGKLGIFTLVGTQQRSRVLLGIRLVSSWLGENLREEEERQGKLWIPILPVLGDGGYAFSFFGIDLFRFLYLLKFYLRHLSHYLFDV